MRSVIWDGDSPITQNFGEHPEIYGPRFGLQGHNGADIGLWTGTILHAPDAGTVVEVGNDPTGYGYYLKLTTDAGEDWLLAHMGQSRAVSVDERVKQGALLGYSNNSGNSTGPHLHLGYRPPHADRSNGFNGYTDPLPRLAALTAQRDEERQMQGLIDELNRQVEALRQQLAERDSTIGSLTHDTVAPLRAEVASLTKSNYQLRAELNALKDTPPVAPPPAPPVGVNEARLRQYVELSLSDGRTLEVPVGGG